MKIITPMLIAMVAHEVNRAYCLSIGDESQPVWDEAPDWQRQSSLVGIDMHTANPNATPEESHASWLAQKVAEGWTYGEVKDVIEKKHPCCRPWDELPPEQRVKDYLFRGVVHVMNRLAEETEQCGTSGAVSSDAVMAGPARVAPVRDGEQAVTYIGRRPSFVDRNYGTNLTFGAGQTRVLPTEIARKFLRHPDVFSPAAATPVDSEPPAPSQAADDTAATLQKAQEQAAAKTQEQTQLQDLRDRITQMDKKGLVEYAQTNYRQQLNTRDKLDDLRAKVLGMVDQFGAV